MYYSGISPRSGATTLTKTWPPADSSRRSKRACVIDVTLDRWRPSSNHKLRQKNLSFVSPSLCCISVLSVSIPVVHTNISVVLGVPHVDELLRASLIVFKVGKVSNSDVPSKNTVLYLSCVASTESRQRTLHIEVVVLRVYRKQEVL